MKTINQDDRVVYKGTLNHWTYNKDLENGCAGKVSNIFNVKEKTVYEVEFDNGIIAAIDYADLDLESNNYQSH